MCVWVCVGVPTHQRWSMIQLIQSSSSSAAAHYTTFKYSPLSHLLCQIVVCESRLCLIPSSFQSGAFFVPVRVPVDLSLWIRHTHLTIEVPAPLPCFSLDCTYHQLYRFNKERAYSHTVSMFLSWQNDLTDQWKQRVALPDRWKTLLTAAYFVWIPRKGTSAIQLALFRL